MNTNDVVYSRTTLVRMMTGDEQEQNTMPGAPPVLVRTLSQQHIVMAITQMIVDCITVIEAGYHRGHGGWTRWFVMRPTASCMDPADMQLVTLWTDAQGQTACHIAPLDLVC